MSQINEYEPVGAPDLDGFAHKLLVARLERIGKMKASIDRISKLTTKKKARGR